MKRARTAQRKHKAKPAGRGAGAAPEAAAAASAMDALWALQGGVPLEVWQLVWGHLTSASKGALRLACKPAAALSNNLVEALTVRGVAQGRATAGHAAAFLERLTGLRTLTIETCGKRPLPPWLPDGLPDSCATRLGALRLVEGDGPNRPWSGADGRGALQGLLARMPQLRSLELHMLGLPPGVLGPAVAAACPSLQHLGLVLAPLSGEDEDEEADMAGPGDASITGAGPEPRLGLSALQGLTSLELRLGPRDSQGWPPERVLMPLKRALALRWVCRAGLGSLQRLVWGDRFAPWNWRGAASTVACLPALTSLELAGRQWPRGLVQVATNKALEWDDDGNDDHDGGYDDQKKEEEEQEDAADERALGIRLRGATAFTAAAAGLRELHLPTEVLTAGSWSRVLARLPLLEAATFQEAELYASEQLVPLDPLKRLMLCRPLGAFEAGWKGDLYHDGHLVAVRLALQGAPSLETLECKFELSLPAGSAVATKVWEALMALDVAMAQARALTDPRVDLELDVCEPPMIATKPGAAVSKATPTGGQAGDGRKKGRGPAAPAPEHFKYVGRRKVVLQSVEIPERHKASPIKESSCGILCQLLPYFSATQHLELVDHTPRPTCDFTVIALGGVGVLCPPARQRLTLGIKMAPAEAHRLAVQAAREGRAGLTLELRVARAQAAKAAAAEPAKRGGWRAHPGVCLEVVGK